MSPFEIMYESKCTTLVSWDSHVDHLMVGIKMLQDVEQIVWEVHKNLKVE